MVKLFSYATYTLLAASLLACATPAPGQKTGQSPQLMFFNNIKALCGARFEGFSSFPDDPGDAFRGQLLVARIETCSENQIRIPFDVGANTSRTWVLSLFENGIELKHDHRHDDGTPDEVTMYGGMTVKEGSELSQSFPADDYTAELIPDAATNEWFLSLSEDGTELTYYLERHAEPRFKAVLTRVSDH